MRSGISTACLYPMHLEQALSTLIEFEFHIFEVFINTSSELKPDYLRTLKQMTEESGSCVKSIHPFTSGFESFLLFSDYERRFCDGLEFYKHYFHAANLLEASILVLHGQRNDKRSRITENEYFEHYARLFELGKSFGVTVAQENVNLFRSDDPDFIRRMRNYLGDECAFVLDVKQAVRGGEDPYEMCAAMGERLVHVHINDNKPGHDCLLPGSGTMDFDALKRIMLEHGYSGDLIIEVYRRDFDKLQELVYAKRVVESLIGYDNCI
ncbi:sugar phosphate isomerase/epimerase [Caproiciproducens galactitolivorans]|uniref:sugar phosphate isomerase/epimerase family protein n=1 Tax=Caproiciproducens galactitolivorans TaxID=642589 RepID=UPI00240A02F1|nr:sugar phosphate isomerase/epimerase [Caproiciproducens galactitolivorans]